MLRENWRLLECLRTNLPRFTVHILYGWKDNQVYFHLQQTVRHLDFRGESYCYFTKDCAEVEQTREKSRRLLECFSQLAFHLPNVVTYVHTQLGGLFLVYIPLYSHPWRYLWYFNKPIYEIAARLLSALLLLFLWVLLDSQGDSSGIP